MIDIKELRIGNIVNYLEDDCNRSASCKRGIITSLTPKKAIINGTGIKYCNLLPINLDEKILQDIGFEHDSYLIGDFSDMFRYKNDSISLCIGINHFNKRIISYDMEEYGESECITEIICTSLHELQNCYFAITNKELEINL